MPSSDLTVSRTADEQPDLVDTLVQTSFLIMAVLNRVGADHDLSLTQLRVLGILRGRRLRMAELASYLGLDKSTLSGLVDRAEKRELVVREPAPSDGRAVEVFLSEAGVALAQRIYADIVQLLSPRTRALSQTDQQRLQRLLAEMLDPT